MGLFGEKLPNIPAFMVSGKDFGWSDVGPMFLLGSTREYPHAVADYDGQFFFQIQNGCFLLILP